MPAGPAEPGTLYVVATPIGNADDVTLRALEILRSVDLVAGEDTRKTGRLLSRHGIKARLVSYYEGNREARGRELVTRLLAGESVALVSSAGTPGLSDPGTHLVRLARAAGVRVSPVPGPSALAAALSVSGFDATRVLFLGFLSRKPGKRRRELEEAARFAGTIVVYESVHRVRATLGEVAQIFGNASVVLCRELTKLHEEVVSGTAAELLEYLTGERLRGEFVILVDNAGRGG